jgi:hypothetical protein
MNLYETLKEAISDCDITGNKSDDAVIGYLSMVLALKTEQSGYDKFMEYMKNCAEHDACAFVRKVMAA